MTPNGTVVGCMVLQSPAIAQDEAGALVTPPYKHPRLSFPFSEMEKVETGNHVAGHDSTLLQNFDFWHGGHEAEHSKVFVPVRGLSITGYRVGEQTSDNLTKRAIQMLLAMNSNPTEEERSQPFMEKAYNKIYQQIPERFFASLDITSSSPKFLLMSRDVPVYLTGFCDSESTYLMWSNESGIEDRLRAHYGERFIYYRMKPLLNGVCVIQSVYLRKKLEAWQYLMTDKLKFMNALEVHLFRRFLTEDSVNSQAHSANP